MSTKSTTTNTYSITSTGGENYNTNSHSFCGTDPYITADIYRKCAEQQRLLPLETTTTNTNTTNNSNNDDVQYRVYYVNERPYIPQWRVEIIKEVSLFENNNKNNNNSNNNNEDSIDVNHNDIDPYQSVKAVAAAIMLLQQEPTTTSTTTPTNTTIIQQYIPDMDTIQNITNHLSVERVMGGVTNTLYKVSGFQVSSSSSSSLLVTDCDHVLVRIFGAEGLIDRDDETGVFAALSQYHLAPSYYGRFQNGRVEGYQDGMRPLHFHELSTGPTSIAKGIATNLARLHYGFRILPTLTIERSQPTLWKQLFDWLDQAEVATFERQNDQQIVAKLELPTIRPELIWLQEEVEKVIDWNSDPIVFCHNDLLAANILYNDLTETIQLIDFEYGGINYRAFDIANHFNEYAGGPPTDVRPDYNLLPTEQQQRYFIHTYLETAAVTKLMTATTPIEPKNTSKMNGFTVTPNHATDKPVKCTTIIEEHHVDAMMKEVEMFLIINHLYWGLWGINQASIEGCAVYDYMTYGVNRIQQYWIQRSKIR